MVAPVGLVTAGLMLGVLTLLTVLQRPQFSVAAATEGGVLVLLAAAWTCVGAAAATLWGPRPGPRKAAILLGLAGLAWLIPHWESPHATPALYAAALLFSSLTPALILHAALTWRGGLRADVWGRVAIVTGYVICGGILGVATALVLDPAALGCRTCPPNPWLLQAGGAWLAPVERVGGAIEVAWIAVGVAMLTRELVGPHRGDKSTAVQVPALMFLAICGAIEFTELGWGLPDRSPLHQGLWVTASLSLAAVGVGALWLLLERRRARLAIGTILVDLARGQQPGQLREVFAARFGDPINLHYAQGDGGWVDATGRPVPSDTRDYPSTPLLYGGRELGRLAHPGRASLPTWEVADLVATTHLGLEHESLTARALAEERELRESGMRLLLERDTERRRLERDLHDGAQQRLVSLALGLQLLERSSPGQPTQDARRHLRQAMDELRTIAQGMSPHLLADAGLTAAIHALAESRDLHVTTTPLGRLDPTVEATAYHLVDIATRKTAASADLTLREATLLIRLAITGQPPDLASATDRVTTLGGRIVRRDADNHTTIEAELPAQPQWTVD